MQFLFITLFFTIITNSYAISWTKEFNGTSSSEKIILSDGRTVSHYKNSGNWKDSFGNYGTQKCYGTILINSREKLKIGKYFVKEWTKIEITLFWNILEIPTWKQEQVHMFLLMELGNGKN